MAKWSITCQPCALTSDCVIKLEEQRRGEQNGQR